MSKNFAQIFPNLVTLTFVESLDSFVQNYTFIQSLLFYRDWANVFRQLFLLEQPSLKARGSQLIPQVLQKSALPPG
jgi:hypothetical protein